jgi:hypothetical protein
MCSLSSLHSEFRMDYICKRLQMFHHRNINTNVVRGFARVRYPAHPSSFPGSFLSKSFRSIMQRSSSLPDINELLSRAPSANLAPIVPRVARPLKPPPPTYPPTTHWLPDIHYDHFFGKRIPKTGSSLHTLRSTSSMMRKPELRNVIC